LAQQPLGSAVTPLLVRMVTDLLSDGDQWVRDTAADTLVILGRHVHCEEVLAAIAEYLRELDSRTPRDSSNYYDRRRNTVWSLKTLVDISGPSAANLIRNWLRSGDAHLQSVAAQLVSGIRESDWVASVLADLAKLSSSRDVSVLSEVARALGEIGQEHANAEILYRLAGLIRHSNSRVSVSAAYAAKRLGDVAATDEIIDAVTNLLEHAGCIGDAESAMEVLASLGRARPSTKRVFERLVLLLRRSEWHLATDGAKIAYKIGPPAATPEVLAALVENVRRLDGSSGTWGDAMDGVRREAINALASLGSSSPPILNALLTRIRCRDRGSAHGFIAVNVWRYALRALTILNASNEFAEAVSETADALTNSDPSVRRAAVEALEELAPDYLGSVHVQKFVSLLRDDPDDRVRAAAARILGRMAPKAAVSTICVALALALSDRGSDGGLFRTGTVGSSAAEALKAFGKRAATTEVLLLIADAVANRTATMSEAVETHGISYLWPRYRTRDLAAEVLAHIGPAAATPTVLTAIAGSLLNKDENSDKPTGDAPFWPPPEVQAEESRRKREELRVSAAVALASMGTAAVAAMPEIVSILVQLLHDDSRSVRYASARALSSMAPAVETDEVIRELLKQITDPIHSEGYSTTESHVFAEALGMIVTPRTMPTISSAVLEMLCGSERRSLSGACELLEQLGATAAVPSIVTALISTDDYHASSAVAKMTGQGMRFFRRKDHTIETRSVQELSEFDLADRTTSRAEKKSTKRSARGG
jgi:HEAT repeat protein